MSLRYELHRRSIDRSRVVGPVVAAASLGAGAIHAAVVPEHLEETWLFGAFFILCAVFQFGWAAAVLLSSSPDVYRLGIVASVAMVAIWAASRTTGLPVGPEPWTAEAVGALDVIATGLEVLLIGLAAWALSATNAGREVSG